MTKRYLGTNYFQIPPEELGYKVGPIRLKRILIQSGIKKSKATERVSFCTRLIKKFLKQEQKRRKISKEVIFELLVLYLKNVPRMEDWEKSKLYRERKVATSGCNHSNGNHISAKVCYTQELYHFILMTPNDHPKSFKKAMIYLKKIVAREHVTQWMTALAGEFNEDGELDESSVKNKMEAIYRQTKRWNALQAPNCKQGVYSNESKIKNGKRIVKFTANKREIAKYQLPKSPVVRF